jgi:sensor c-di-GMP phosphodiesterase-like protein
MLRQAALALIEILLGAFVGFQLGESLLVNTARTELRAYAQRLVSHADLLGKETTDVLIAVESSHHSPCSEADIAFMQGLIHETRFLRDAARIHNNSFICTARRGKIEPPKPVSPFPDLVTSKGSRIYRNAPNLIGDDLENAVLFPNSGVFIDDRAFFDTPEFPMRYSTFSVNPDTLSAFLMFGNSLSLRPQQVLGQQEGIHNGILFTSACSQTFPMCQVASISIDDVLSERRSVQVALAAFGSIVGLLFALMATLFLRRQRTLDKQLRRAISRKELYLLYQPIVDLPSGEICGAEALVRWKSSTGENITPDIFIPVAERGGFIGEITRLVIRRATAELAPLCRRNPDFHISINIAAADLTDPAVFSELDQCISRLNIPASSIALELTERSTSEHAIVRQALTRLRERGHRIFIDDFGTGYSSLSYLHTLDIDGIKIDRSFTATIGTEAITAAIVPQIMAMAAALNLAVVVEGVETAAQVAYFSALDRPTSAQGWYFSKPIPPEELIRKTTVALPVIGLPVL